MTKKSSMDQLYQSIDESLESQFRQKALNQLVLDAVSGNTVFEVGCGSGTLLKLLLQRGYNATGCDISPTQCKLARKRLLSAGFSSNIIHQDSLQKTSNWKKRFDTVICIDVLEHIKDDKKAIQLLAQLLKPKGRLIIIVPALPRLWSKRDEKYGHYRRYTKESLKKILSTVPIDTQTFRYWNFVGTIIAWIMFKLNLDLATDRLAVSNKQPLRGINKVLGFWLHYIERYISFPFGMSILAVVQKTG